MRTSTPTPSSGLLGTGFRRLSAVLSTVALFLLMPTVALAQVEAPTWQVPETPPTPWWAQFVGRPVFILSVVLALGFGLYYGFKLYRSRYPKAS